MRLLPPTAAPDRGPWCTARWVTLVPAALAALWFLLIGIHALVLGQHFGPLGAASWAEALSDARVPTRIVGVALALWGLAWCAAVYALLAGGRLLWPLALALGLLSLWQEPVGTFLGLYVLGALALFKGDLRGGTRRGPLGERAARSGRQRHGPRGQALRRR